MACFLSLGGDSGSFISVFSRRRAPQRGRAGKGALDAFGGAGRDVVGCDRHTARQAAEPLRDFSRRCPAVSEMWNTIELVGSHRDRRIICAAVVGRGPDASPPFLGRIQHMGPASGRVSRKVMWLRLRPL